MVFYQGNRKGTKTLINAKMDLTMLSEKREGHLVPRKAARPSQASLLSSLLCSECTNNCFRVADKNSYICTNKSIYVYPYTTSKIGVGKSEPCPHRVGININIKVSWHFILSCQLSTAKNHLRRGSQWGTAEIKLACGQSRKDVSWGGRSHPTFILMRRGTDEAGGHARSHPSSAQLRMWPAASPSRPDVPTSTTAARNVQGKHAFPLWSWFFCHHSNRHETKILLAFWHRHRIQAVSNLRVKHYENKLLTQAYILMLDQRL